MLLTVYTVHRAVDYFFLITLFFNTCFSLCSSILEYDSEGFMKLSLLFQVQGFFCIVHSKCDCCRKCTCNLSKNLVLAK